MTAAQLDPYLVIFWIVALLCLLGYGIARRRRLIAAWHRFVGPGAPRSRRDRFTTHDGRHGGTSYDGSGWSGWSGGDGRDCDTGGGWSSSSSWSSDSGGSSGGSDSGSSSC